MGGKERTIEREREQRKKKKQQAKNTETDKVVYYAGTHNYVGVID